MLNLLFSILSSGVIFALFKLAEIKKVDNVRIIIINYLTASILGFSLNRIDPSLANTIHSNWLFLAIFIGVMFIGMFFLIGYSAQKAGISVTTVSTKMSVVVPILFSILYDPQDKISLIKALGIGLALVALFLSVYKKRTEKLEMKFVFLPVILFFGMGLVDSFVKFAQQDYLDDNNLPMFTAFTFAGALFTGLIVLAVLRYPIKNFLSIKAWVIGILLGSANFGSMYFLVRALEYGNFASSAVFGINNIGIVSVSVFLALLFFKERLKPINWIGILVAVMAIWILSTA
ncbi:MAG: DMT family transporter [Bacteroidales bacterium]|nr:DMT family transporter [Bacteroidales bacterium]MCF8455602.1 DMT family transporter [Bacteroidales bacterium]